jgi:hypothetical protein
MCLGMQGSIIIQVLRRESHRSFVTATQIVEGLELGPSSNVGVRVNTIRVHDIVAEGRKLSKVHD